MIRIMSSLPHIAKEVVHVVVATRYRPVCGMGVIRLHCVAGNIVGDEGARGHGGGESELLGALLRDRRGRNGAHIVRDRVGGNMGTGGLLVIHHESLVPVGSIDDRRSAQARAADDRR